MADRNGNSTRGMNTLDVALRTLRNTRQDFALGGIPEKEARRITNVAITKVLTHSRHFDIAQEFASICQLLGD